MTRKRHPPEPFASFAVHMHEDGTGTVAYERDGVVELQRVAQCSCTWVLGVEVARLPDPRCPVPGHRPTPPTATP